MMNTVRFTSPFTNFPQRSRLLVGCASLALLLGGCGGSSDNGDPNEPDGGIIDPTNPNPAVSIAGGSSFSVESSLVTPLNFEPAARVFDALAEGPVVYVMSNFLSDTGPLGDLLLALLADQRDKLREVIEEELDGNLDLDDLIGKFNEIARRLRAIDSATMKSTLTFKVATSADTSAGVAVHAFKRMEINLDGDEEPMIIRPQDTDEGAVSANASVSINEDKVLTVGQHKFMLPIGRMIIGNVVADVFNRHGKPLEEILSDLIDCDNLGEKVETYIEEDVHSLEDFASVIGAGFKMACSTAIHTLPDSVEREMDQNLVNGKYTTEVTLGGKARLSISDRVVDGFDGEWRDDLGTFTASRVSDGTPTLD